MAQGSVRGGPRDVVAAGVVVFGPDRTVLLVHRPKYDDWSFPKGKLDPGERAAAAAVREVLEETGVQVRLGPPLGSQRYPIRGGDKTVLYWAGRPGDGHDIGAYVPNDEVDEVRWVPEEKARGKLTYEHDVATLEEALEVRKRTRTLVVLRHAVARSKRTWSKDDRLRPLLAGGHRQAERLVPVLAAYGVARLVSSGSTRCVQTLAPYAAAVDAKVEVDDALSEEDATPKRVRRVVTELLDDLEASSKHAGGTVLCTHRPVLPMVFDALGLPDPKLEKGEMLVMHLRHGSVVATERHQGG